MGVEEIYAAMRNSGMAHWVGDGDPAVVGATNFTSIIENLPLRPEHAVFDFGCGIGRTAVMLADFLDAGGRVVGTDIVPAQIQFCREQLAHSFPNATFHCLNASNPGYDHLMAKTADTAIGMDEDAFFRDHEESFDVVVAFSVFTHFDPTMAARYLQLLRNVTKIAGYVMLTWFLDHPGNSPEARLEQGEDFRDLRGNLVFALFSPAAVFEMATAAGLWVERISYGLWRQWPGAPLKGSHYQDIVILRRPLPIDFDANIYLEIHKDVAAAGIDPVVHYLLHGRKEGRRLR